MHSSSNQECTIKCHALWSVWLSQGRYIGDNIRQILEVIEYYETSKKAGLIFVADFEKAFDKVGSKKAWLYL